MIQSACISQDSSKVWIPRKDALKVLAAADSGRIYMAAANEYKRNIDTLNKIIARKQAAIDTLNSLDATNQKIIATYEAQIKLMTDEKKIYQKALLKQKRRKKLAMFSGIGGMGILLYLYITK